MNTYTLKVRLELTRPQPEGIPPKVYDGGVAVTGYLDNIRNIMNNQTLSTSMFNVLEQLLGEAEEDEDKEAVEAEKKAAAAAKVSDGKAKQKERKAGPDGAKVGKKPAGNVPAPDQPPTA